MDSMLLSFSFYVRDKVPLTFLKCSCFRLCGLLRSRQDSMYAAV